ncbi:MAG: hypothetical protein KF723_08380 [Rhizobiaceae bacterium]|nr:hypothetical protein [Rhizobiaceae bacterium]
MAPSESRMMNVQDRLSGPATSRLTGTPRTAGPERPAAAAAHALAPYAAALRAVGVDRVAVNAAHAASASTAPGLDSGPATSRLAQVTGDLAADFDTEYQRIRADNPALGVRDARAAAQYNTIMTYRSEFPPGEFSVRAPGSAATAPALRIPPIAVSGPAPATPIAATVSTGHALPSFLLAAGSSVGASVGLSTAAAHYAEWA